MEEKAVTVTVDPQGKRRLLVSRQIRLPGHHGRLVLCEGFIGQGHRLTWEDGSTLN
jgi:hypothetical protein